MNNKHHLKPFCFFLATIIVVHVALALFFLNKFSKGDLYTDETKVFNPTKPYNYLFVGDSHCQKGVDTSIVKQAIKWTGGGENNIVRYYKIKHLLTNAKPPKYLLLSSDLTTYTSTTANYMRNYFYYNRFVDFNEWGQIRGDKWATLTNAYKYKLFPYIETRDIYLRTTENLLLKEQKKQTYTIAQKTPAQNQQQATDFVENTMLSKNSTTASLYDTVALVYLKKTLDLCAQYQIKVLFVKYPLSNYLIKAFETKVGANQITQLPAHRLIEQYPNASILNYEQIFVNNNQYFADCQHLNPAGATAFSTILQHDLQNLPQN